MDRKMIVTLAAVVLAVGSATVAGVYGCGANTGQVVRQEARNALDCIPPAITALQQCQAQQRQGCVTEALFAGIACVLQHPLPAPLPAAPSSRDAGDAGAALGLRGSVRSEGRMTYATVSEYHDREYGIGHGEGARQCGDGCHGAGAGAGATAALGVGGACGRRVERHRELAGGDGGAAGAAQLGRGGGELAAAGGAGGLSMWRRGDRGEARCGMPLGAAGDLGGAVSCILHTLVAAPEVEGCRVVGTAHLTVPAGEVRVLVVEDGGGARRAVYWNRETRTMVAPVVDKIVTAPGGPVMWPPAAR